MTYDLCGHPRALTGPERVLSSRRLWSKNLIGHCPFRIQRERGGGSEKERARERERDYSWLEKIYTTVARELLQEHGRRQ